MNLAWRDHRAKWRSFIHAFTEQNVWGGLQACKHLCVCLTLRIFLLRSLILLLTDSCLQRFCRGFAEVQHCETVRLKFNPSYLHVPALRHSQDALCLSISSPEVKSFPAYTLLPLAYVLRSQAELTSGCIKHLECESSEQHDHKSPDQSITNSSEAISIVSIQPNCFIRNIQTYFFPHRINIIVISFLISRYLSRINRSFSNKKMLD